MSAALIALASSIVGGIIVTAASYLLSEKSKTRDRQLDFYKLIYPEKMKAALDLNNLASQPSWTFVRGTLARKMPTRASKSDASWTIFCGVRNLTNSFWEATLRSSHRIIG